MFDEGVFDGGLSQGWDTEEGEDSGDDDFAHDGKSYNMNANFELRVRQSRRRVGLVIQFFHPF